MARTEAVFQADAYAKRCEARLISVADGRIELDRTVFYPTGGGQPGDSGRLTFAGGDVAIESAVKGEEPGTIVHLAATDSAWRGLAPGDTVTAEIDWSRRHRLMRMHTCLHLLSAVLPYPVTGGQVGEGKGRLDLDVADAALDKAAITAELNRLVGDDAAVSAELIAEADLARRPDLVKTLSVKPPAGAGEVRLMRVEGLDLQACGGTHVARTGEIGAVAVSKIESKGRRNRRVTVSFV